ncbi:MAG TPA: peptidoglycan-associated lipoprotein Pal [Thermoanaerobaculia bacterium]|nr:peptidoglycan-associated lipoprotein Pal [Thermoanaerobaculia bacterium]
MTKAVKGFLSGLVLIALVAAPACRHKTTPTPKVAPDTAASATVPPVEVTAPQPQSTQPQPITTNTDFVQSETMPKVTEEPLSGNIEEANRQAQLRGFIKDAYFGYDEAALGADAQAALTDSANWLKRNAGYNLLIEGHCDERGTEQYNLALGDRRANQAKQYLMTLGIDAGRIRTVSYGEERPFDPGHDEAAWAKNRRAHLVLVR